MAYLLKKKKKKKTRTELRRTGFNQLTIRAKRDLSLLYRIGLAEGRTDEEIRQGNDWNLEVLETAKKVFYETEEAEVIGLSSKKAFIEYMTRQLGLIRELNDFLKSATRVNSPAADVSAIKAKSEIYDKVMDRALSLGFLKRERSSMVLEEELDISDLSSPDLVERLRENFKDLNILIHKENPMLIENKTSKTVDKPMHKVEVKRKLKLKRKLIKS